MSDVNVFARFIYEIRTLLTAIESHANSLSGAAPSERRPDALREMARLSHAAAALASAFEVDDLRALSEALAEAATVAEATNGAEPLAPLGSLDTLSYLRWRVERLATAGNAEPPTARDLTLIRKLEQTLRAYPAAALAGNDAAIGGFTGPSELTLDELALVQSFPSAHLRKRDERADAQLLARMTAPPVFMAQTHSGAGVPVFGGMTAEEFDEIPPEMKRNFVQEIPADLRDIGQLILEFEQRPDETQALAKMEFLAHKIKGAAATMGFLGFADVARLFEEIVATAQHSTIATDPLFLASLGRFLGIFEQSLEAATTLDEPSPELLADARAVRDALIHADERRPAQQASLAATSSDAAQPSERRRPSEHELVLHIEARKLDLLMNQLSAIAANRGAMTRNRGEIARALAEMQATLVRLREKSAQITDAHPLTFDNLVSVAQQAGPSHQLATPGVSTPSGGLGVWPADTTPMAALTSSGVLRASWSSLQLEQYTEVDAALRALAEVVADANANFSALTSLIGRLGQLTEAQESLSRDIQEDAMSIRLAQLAEITPRLRISALVAATDLGKLVEFEAQGEGIEIDRSLLEELEKPLIQLVRNAIAHGIERPDERLEHGKPAQGRVWIHAYNVGAEVVIEVSDDGRGVNPNLLVGAAIGAQLITPDEARGLSQEQALSFMFRLGVTTLPATTAGYVGALAGSGVGLADVANTIHRLKGSITLRSDLRKGTTFQIRVPISLSMLPVLEVSAGGQVFALPFALVENTAIVEPERLREQPSGPAQMGAPLREWRVTVEAASDAAASGEPAALPQELTAYALAETLGFEQDAAALGRIVVIRLRGQSVALLVESVGDGDVREATVRPLPQPLQRRVVRGVIVRPEDGQVALLIDPQEALALRLAGAEIVLRPASAPATPRDAAPWVLIVDDSVTIRRTLEQTLTLAGFKTSLARDGYEALEMMEHELPRVIVLDVEMPRLSGFELLTIMRSSPQYQQVRVAMLTSRAADKHRDYALAIGADAYLVKPCPQETLVETIRRLLTDSELE